MNFITLYLPPSIQITDDQFFEICQINELIKIERNVDGSLILKPLLGGINSNINAGLTAQLANWNDDKSQGVVFGSDVGFILPNGAIRSPSAAWMKLERWDALTEEEKEKFPPICPDFLIELMSPSDSFKTTQEKMQEYIDNGVRLGILINRKSRQVEIYRPGKEVEVLDSPATVSGEDVLRGFVLNLVMIW
ncbi:MAG: Uma2 family endonuclease [Dolichospermum sp.]|jgi:Uma2 family endonuclease|uniref:Uma2 family endonuclease n=1 Tax=Dolichospermum circinale TaxID=109265 RepID=UPI00232B049E|nr:Uma2 family endonuclease [Dolichospermum circinale]MCE2718456.1 Uma2 family endonuclease [Anabaena sp. 49628_E55]MDB9456492.1 Uma2 family endonuclease [Dolichospermum circinale CS-541/06]MDB9464301.1 Uma2 family endonuclease [Dolichospermum circinale CS-541/04]MDB9547641.1 Uma2 family endonuclease [Dolichospermum circinale CS-1031]